jgi:rhamnosyltransferase
MSHSRQVSAIAVTYHPTLEHLENLRKLRAQVDVLIVVDNGSKEETLAELRLVGRQTQFVLIENGANLGIATALNRGVREAQREGCRWIALFDQDSMVTDGFMAALIQDFEELQKTKNIVQIVPRYLDPATGRERPVSRFADGGVFLSITSGSLFSMEAFERCGLFQEELFIYCVDDDYSLRIRKRGFFIGASRNAVLLHASGHPTSRKILGRTISTRNYRPEARYYYARNKVWILRRYGFDFPRLILPTLREFVTTVLKIALMEEGFPRKIEFFLWGLADGIRGKTGPMRRAA